MENQEAPKETNAPAKDAAGGSAPSTGSAKTNTLAIVAIICSIIIPLLGLILGIVSLAQIKKSKEGGKGLAVASIIISIVIMAAYILWIAFWWTAIFNLDKAAKDAGVKVNTSTGTVSVNKDGESTQIGSDVKLPSGFPSAMPIYSGAKLSAASDRKSTRLNSSHSQQSRMPSSA